MQVNLFECFGDCIFIRTFVVPEKMLIFIHKIESAINNLMMTGRMQRRMNAINCQVKFISKNEINVRY